ncbi:MAG: hypothetical protein IKE70_00025 [Bacilli bacterium]|nr:hypothetical protein [Bacilli bacterium]
MKKLNKLLFIFSLLLSLSIHLRFVINNSLNDFVKNFSFFDLSFIIKTFLLTIVIYFIINILFYFIDKIPFKKNVILFNRKKILFIFMIIFINTMIFLLSHFPAVYLNDSIFLMNYPFDGLNPIIYSMFMSFIFITLKLFVDKTITVFIMSIIQSIISSIILTYIIYWFHKKINNKILTIVLFCYYAFVPIISNYNMALIKDTPFALCMLLLFTLVYEIVESKGKVLEDRNFRIKLILICVFSSYIRRNGFIVIIISLVILFIQYGLHHYRKQFIKVFLLFLVFSSFDFFMLRVCNIKYYAREKYAIPIQQVSYLVRYDSDRLSKNDYDFLSKIIKKTKTTVRKDYNEFTVDGIKYSDKFNIEELNKYEFDFLIFWIKKFPSNISSYVKSYLLTTYDLWAVNRLVENQSIIKSASIKFVGEDMRIKNKVILPDFIYKGLKSFYGIFDTFLNPAGCFILLILSCIYSYNKKRKEIFKISLPLIVLWIVLMLSTPLSSALRYMSPYLYLLPIIVLYSFKVTREDEL